MNCYINGLNSESQVVESDFYFVIQAGEKQLSYLPIPPLRQDMTQGQFLQQKLFPRYSYSKQSLAGLNSEFSFS